MIKNICTYDMHVLVNGSRTNAPRKNASLRKNAPRKIVPWKIAPRKIAPKKNCPPKKCPLGKLLPSPRKLTTMKFGYRYLATRFFISNAFFNPASMFLNILIN